jgi:hypothetical protein
MEQSTSTSSSSGARKMSGVKNVKGVHLGGAWAQWQQKLEDGAEKVEASEHALHACQSERDDTAATLARTAATLANTESALALGRSECEEMAKELSG